MAKVTAKLQVTIPKAVADAYGLRPGSEIDWQPSADAIRVVPAVHRQTLTPEERLRLFDAATARQERRNRAAHKVGARTRGWTREELYDRGRAR
jgi:AbrB family looped-hinge helix DNA binding protein